MEIDWGSSKLRVLLVEDEPLHQKLFAAWINQAGHQVVGVLDPRKAEAAMLHHLPDIAIIDIRLPHIDGLKLIALLRRRPELIAIPIIAVTVLNDEYDERSCLLAGADVYVTKPFSRAELLALLHRFAAGRESVG
ncbi:response regulator [Croceicoccus marinus]|uniref:Response regulator n=1 Tax=Croceicoccus marinus TaxID=450378 RepID=A0A7G6VW94_9SPHN|nr:response regulator [Croceicoccus marinus]